MNIQTRLDCNSYDDADIHPLLTRAGGQVVIHKQTGRFGMTTGEARKKTDTIGVIWEGHPYDVLVPLEDLTPATAYGLTS